MGYDAIPYEKRIKENIKNYSLSTLYDMNVLQNYLENLAKMLDVSFCLPIGMERRKLQLGKDF